MVHIKVSNGVETRRFQVAEDLTFEQLREKLVAIFSATVDKSLNLQYRDSDGDVITISSDEELQTALSGVSNDAVLKLHMKRPTIPRRRHQQSLFRDIFGQTTDFWDHFEKQLSTTGSVLEQLWGNGERRDGCCDTVCCEGRDSTTENKTSSSDGEEVKSKVDSHTAKLPTSDEEVKSKVEEEPVKSKPSQSENNPQIRSHTVVSWEPRVQYTCFGPRTVLRPVRYNILYLADQESTEKPSEKTVRDQTKNTPEATPQETAAVH